MRCFGRSNAPKVPVRPKDVSQNDRDAAAVDGLQDTNDELAAQINQQNAIMVEQENTIAQLELSSICTLEERVRESSEKDEVCGQLLHRIEQFEQDNKRLRDERDIMREERDQAFEDYGILIDKQDNLNEEAKQLYIHGIKRSYGRRANAQQGRNHPILIEQRCISPSVRFTMYLMRAKMMIRVTMKSVHCPTR